MAAPTAVVCEDDPTVRRVIEGVLRQHGINVISELETSLRLAEVVRYGKPDVVVLDLVLAGSMGADEALAEMAEVAQTTPVVVFSAHDALRDLCLGRGARAFVDKPDFEELGRVIAALVDQGANEST